MSCRETDKPEVLVYVRRTTGGGVNGVIYNWDYYLMASLPTNDNVRYSRPEHWQSDKPEIPLHEIGNNRYEDMVCKSTHLAYRVGGFNRLGAIEIDGAKNEVDKKKETTDNPCVLLLVSSSNFYARLPECWPWSCRRWTAEISGEYDKTTGKSKKIIKYFKEDQDGKKVAVTDIPYINISVKGEGGVNISATKKIYKVTKDTYGSDITKGGGTNPDPITILPPGVAEEQETMNGSFYQAQTLMTASKNEEGDYEEFSDEILELYKCGQGTKEIKFGIEIFPVLCRGTCKLVIKMGYMCYDKIGGTPKGGRSGKRLISPFWSCRINEEFSLYREATPGQEPTSAEQNRPSMATAKVYLNATDLMGQEDFGPDEIGKTKQLTVITGSDYYHDIINNQKYRIPWNTCDGPPRRIYYGRSAGETFGKSQEYLNAGADCCKYCKSADEDGNITFSNNLYCSALDPECDGKPYGMYDDPCPKTGGSGSSDGGGTTNGGIFTSVLMGGIGGGTGGSAGGGGYQGGGGDLGGGFNFLFS